MTAKSSAKVAGNAARSFSAGFNACQQEGIGHTFPKDAGDITVEKIVANAIAETQEELKWSGAWNNAPKVHW